MAHRTTSYKDRAGNVHDDAETATIADLAIVLGRVGGETGMAQGIARKIFEQWNEFEQVMIEHRAIADPVVKLKAVGDLG
jgi:hypothetical protein